MAIDPNKARALMAAMRWKPPSRATLQQAQAQNQAAQTQTVLAMQAQNALSQIASAQANTQSQIAQINASAALTMGSGGAVSMVGGASTLVTVGGSTFTTILQGGDTLPSFARPDPKQPDTLGWRAWVWSEDAGRLVSPHQSTPWLDDSLIVPHWDEGDAVRGVSGIHARLVPKNWRIIGWPDGDGSGGLSESPMLVTGVVERYGRYVLGTLGWRAEHVVIRELMAPSTEIGLAIEKAYPSVIVHYPDQNEGETPCKSVKSSEVGRGSRPAPPSLPLPTQSAAPSQTLSRLRSLIADLSSPQNSNLPKPEVFAVKALGQFARIWKDAGLKPLDVTIAGIRVTIGPADKV